MAKRILIADDSVTMQKAFAITFAAEDVTVMAARSADEALVLARQARPDLVIADIAMPGRSGYELCQSIKSEPGLRGVPVFVLGSAHTPVDEARLRHCGADGQTLKPFDSAAMIELVWEAVARGATAEGAGAPIGYGSAEAAAAAARELAELASIEQHSATGVGGDDSDDYGEIAIEESAPTFTSPEPAAALAFAAAEDMVTPPPEPRPQMGAARPQGSVPMSPSSAMPAVPAGMRPSLIPGLTPGVVPAAGARAPLPGATAAPSGGRSAGTARPASPSAGAPAGHGPGPMAVRGQAPPVPASTPATARTLVGLPVVSAQPPPRPAGVPARAGAAGGMATGAGAGPATSPPLSSMAPAPPVATLPPGAADGLHRSPALATAAAVASRVDQKMAALATRGPEYEAIAKLSREIIERVVWEVVPQLAEAIVREELAKRGRI